MAAARSKKQNSKTLLITAGVVAAALLIAVWVGGRVGSARELSRAFENLTDAQSFSTDVELVLHLPRLLRGAERPFTEIRATVAGDVRRAEAGTAELTGTLYAEAKGRGNVFFADGDLRILENEVLFRLDNLPVFLNRSGSLVNRWTRVETSLLETRNMGEIRGALSPALMEARRAGSEKIDGERLMRFVGKPTAEQEEALVQLLDRQSSGSQAWHVVSRLLRANNIDLLEVWVDSSSEEVRRIRAHFVRPLSGDRTFDFAQLTISFRDFDRTVTIDRPEAKLEVQPQGFARLFGEGTVESIETGENAQ